MILTCSVTLSTPGTYYSVQTTHSRGAGGSGLGGGGHPSQEIEKGF